ncbi:MAG: insulinase family protein [Rikenellaceae bacterium]|nr:insulinase family protein [Rikenellaceae bacterium]
MEYEVFELDNGIKCVLGRVRSAVLHCGLTIGAGTRDEADNEHGMAHFIEHLLFKGTAKRRAYHINSLLDNVGGELNAYTTKEETVVHATVLKGDYAKAADLIADVVFNSLFAERDIETERGVIIDEINSYKDSPSEAIYDDFEDMVFAGSSLGRNILGTRRSISRFRSDDLRRFVERHYTTDRMVFSVVGNVSSARFRQVAHDKFGRLPARRSAVVRQGVAPYVTGNDKVSKGTYQSHFIMGGRSCSCLSHDRTAVALMVNVLGGMSSGSRLNVALRERNGLCYSVEAGFASYCDTGVVTVCFGCDKENLCQCCDLAVSEIERMKNEPLTPRALAMAKKQLLGQIVIASENAESLMLSAGKSMLVYGQVESYEGLKARVDAVTADDICRCAATVFDQDNLSSLTYI